MSDEPENNESNESNDNIGDDYGIRNDQIVDICDTVIKQLWDKVYLNHSDGSKKSLDLSELQSVAFTLSTVWDLIQRILDLDEQLRYFDPDLTEDDDDSDESESDPGIPNPENS